MTETRRNVMTKEEEQDMDMLRVQRSRQRSGSFRFENTDQSSGSSDPSSSHQTNLNSTHIFQKSTRLRIGYAETKGKRATMEDEIAVVGRLRNRDDEDFVAVYDGHGGKDVSLFAGKHLHQYLVKFLTESENPVQALKLAFNATHDEVKSQNIPGGTTALISLFLKDKCYIANLGDSRAVLSANNGEITKRISTDHKPHLPEEEQRVTAQGGFVTKQSNRNGQTISRVNGLLAVSRALGDVFLDKFVSHEPDIIEVDLRDEQNVLILACDGLWDVVSDEEATKLIADMDSPEQAAITLRNTALSKGSTDNISVIVVFIPSLKSNSNNSNNNNNNNTNVPTKSSSGSASKVQAGENINSSGPSSDTSPSSPTIKHRKPHNSNPSVSEKNAPDSTSTTTTTSTENETQQQSNENRTHQRSNSNSSNQNNNSQQQNSTRTVATQPSNSQIWKTVAPIVVGVSALLVGVASYIVAKKL